MAERIYAFEPYAARASGNAAGAGITIAPRRPVAMLNVRGPADAVAAELQARCGLQLSPEPNTAVGSSTRVLWLGPDEWLVVENVTPTRIPRNPGQSHITATDVSHGRAALRLRGAHVRDALVKGCALDLDPRVFPAGRCAQTAIGRISVILDHVEPDVIDVYCSRSYAGSFWHWIAHASAEYRYTIAPPE
ncbi:MAG TPA: sarcosine oxidase subunit gamma family protein [Burkholderiales bacterium]|nr:sarcosine oxidase subunit gamma family protein [Burkholderiales bacterium]